MEEIEIGWDTILEFISRSTEQSPTGDEKVQARCSFQLEEHTSLMSLG